MNHNVSSPLHYHSYILLYSSAQVSVSMLNLEKPWLWLSKQTRDKVARAEVLRDNTFRNAPINSRVIHFSHGD